MHLLQDHEAEVGPELFVAAQQLKALLRGRLGWEFDLEVLFLEG